LTEFSLPATHAALLAVLHLIAAPGFGGWFGSWLFDVLRGWFPCPDKTTGGSIPRWQRPIYRALWRRPDTVYTSKVFTFVGGLIAAGAAGWVAHLAGGDAMSAMDAGIAAAVSGLVAVGAGEVRHQGNKKTEEKQGGEF
jgi:hypothetical protein